MNVEKCRGGVGKCVREVGCVEKCGGGVGKGVGAWGKCVGVWGEGVKKWGEWENMGEERKSVLGVGESEKRCGKMCWGWDVGKVRGEVGRGVGV